MDRDEARLDRIAACYQPESLSAQLEGSWDKFDAAIVAVPPNAHADICVALLEADKHVLVEKPIATQLADVDRILNAEASSSGTLHVGHMRRFLAVNQWLRQIIRAGELGEIQSVVAEEGVTYAWEAATKDHFSLMVAGGGVLIDIGVHVLDILEWWLGPLSLVSYEDDNLGGVEANAVAVLACDACPEIKLELSRSRKLQNAVRLKCEHGQIEAGLHENEITEIPQLPRRLRPRLHAQSFQDLFEAQLRSWLRVIDGCAAEASNASGRDAARVADLVDLCYQRRAVLDLPWATDSRSMAGHV